MDGNHYATYEEAKAAGAAVIGYGTFLTAVINFLIMAFVIFLLVKGMNKLSEANPLAKKGGEEESAPDRLARLQERNSRRRNEVRPLHC